MNILRVILLSMCVVFLALWSVSGSFFDDFISDGAPDIRYCDDDWECWLTEGIEVIRPALNDIETERTAAQYVQDVIEYLLWFLFLVAVIYMIYAWFQILIAAWDEEKVKKGKNIIVSAAIGLVIIFLAFSIVRFIFNILGVS